MWTRPECQGAAPLPRAAHTATSWGDRFLVIFGGGSAASCHDDIHTLDTRTMTWHKLELAEPEVCPSPRAGHAAAALGRFWYVVGGGNNTTGCTDVYALDLAEVPRGRAAWTKLGLLPDRSPITSEGMSLVPISALTGLLAFGGYNGRYQNALHLYVSVADTEPQEQQRSGPETEQNQQQQQAPGAAPEHPKVREG